MNLQDKVSTYFKWAECLWLPSWGAYHYPSEQEQLNIMLHAEHMDTVRNILGLPIKIHCWLRPVLNNSNSSFDGQDYNEFVHGAKNSRHKVGLACDFDVEGKTCDEVREILEPKLPDLGMRMEKNPGSLWVHLDTGAPPPGGSWYFLP